MMDKDEAGTWSCAEHPAWRSSSEENAAMHLMDEHPKLAAFLAAVEVTPLHTRAEQRRAARDAGQRATVRRRRRTRAARHN